MKNILGKYRAKLQLTLMSKGKNFEDIDVIDIPKQWANFQDTNDKWVNIEFPESENITACIYNGKEGSVFAPHKHKKNIEQFVIISPNGKLEVTTEESMSILKYPESVFFKKNKVHACKFLTDTKILIMWAPRFTKGWSAEFIKDDE